MLTFLRLCDIILANNTTNELKRFRYLAVLATNPFLIDCAVAVCVWYILFLAGPEKIYGLE